MLTCNESPVQPSEAASDRGQGHSTVARVRHKVVRRRGLVVFVGGGMEGSPTLGPFHCPA